MKITSKTIIGQVKVQKRNTNEFVDVNIVKITMLDKVALALEKDSRQLIHEIFSDEYFNISMKSNKKRGLYLSYILKTPHGQDYKGLAKIMDVLAVKESIERGFGGKIYLNAVGNANPLHWARGFRNIRDLKKTHNPLMQKIKAFFQAKRNAKMQKLFDKFVAAVKNGQNGLDAQEELTKHWISSEIMGLPEELLQQHIEATKEIEYF